MVVVLLLASTTATRRLVYTAITGVCIMYYRVAYSAILVLLLFN
jgi:hypothetical protein